MPFEFLLFAIVVIGALFAGIFFWRERIDVPRVVGTVLPPYDVPELIITNGVLVENRGRARAHNVRIALRYPEGSVERIRNLQILFKGKYEITGGEQTAFLNLEMPELGSGERLTIYYSGSHKSQPQVTITFDRAK